MSSELQKMQDQMAVAPAPSVGEMLALVVKGVTEKGLTTENAQVMEKLMGLYERAEARQAEKDFNVAFVRLKAEMPKVQATKAVPDRNGGVRYKYAPLEEIEKQIGPFLEKHGFSYSFSQKYENNRMIQVCRLFHISGHSQSNEYSVRVGNGPPGSTETQADGSAGTYARRYALLDSLGIVVEHVDNDARALGSKISKEQAEELARRVNEVGASRERFLKFAGASTFFEIDSVKYDMLDQFLQEKEKKGR